MNLVTLSGYFDSSKSDEAKKVFQSTKESVTVDMSALDFISSAGVGVLVSAYRDLNAEGKTISLINLKPHIKRVFEISLLDKFFEIK